MKDNRHPTKHRIIAKQKKKGKFIYRFLVHSRCNLSECIEHVCEVCLVVSVGFLLAQNITQLPDLMYPGLSFSQLLIYSLAEERVVASKHFLAFKI